jgi:hypothetical protein
MFGRLLKTAKKASKLLKKGTKKRKRPMRNIKVKNYARRNYNRGGKI